MAEPTVKAVDVAADRIRRDIVRGMMQCLDDIKGMPIKGSYNSMTGSYGRTQRDVLTAFKGWAKQANLAFKALTGKDVDVWQSIDKMECNDGDSFFE